MKAKQEAAPKKIKYQIIDKLNVNNNPFDIVEWVVNLTT